VIVQTSFVELPRFRYHPDPLANGMFVATEATCVVCRQARGFLYTGVPHSEEEIDEESICPWCIADGSAHEKLGAEFTDAASIGSGLVGTGPVSPEVAEEIAFRTPGFSGWQNECWFTHCDDGTAFLGVMGGRELSDAGPEAIRAIQESTGLDDESWDDFFAARDREGSPAAYLFRCLHCGQFGGYTDAD
jgi:uncharacterized protein CbrC (UPF0167 family)